MNSTTLTKLQSAGLKNAEQYNCACERKNENMRVSAVVSKKAEYNMVFIVNKAERKKTTWDF